MNFGGSPIIGVAEGTFITVERSEDSFSTTTGSDGETLRVRNRNVSGTITFTLMQSSPSNDILSTAWQLDEKYGRGVAPFGMAELNGTTMAAGPNTWVQKPPTIERGKEASSCEWVLATDRLEMFVGGLPLIPSLLGT
jgi:hypothetical protein